jgi:K+-sensing histidine kinase KdpD
MRRNQITNFRNSARFFLGSIALALVTVVFVRLGVDLASTAFAYLIVVVLFALMGSFIAPALFAVMSVAGLVYFFAPPTFDFRIDNPQHIGVMVGFLLASLIVTRLIRSAREAVVSCPITLSVTSENND